MAYSSDYSVSEDTIFVSGLPEDVTEDQLSDYFGQIGVIKFDKKNNCPKIWIYKDKASGKGKGEATITYDDPPTATSAISWFNGKDFHGSTLSIQLAQRKAAPQFNRGGRGRGGGGFRDGGGGFRDGAGGRSEPYNRFERGGGGDRDRDRSRPGGQGRPGDWLCPSCNNNNFAYRQKCNRCQTEKPGGGSGGGVGGGRYGDSGSRDSGRDSSRDGGRDSGRDGGRDSGRDGGRDSGGRHYNGGRYDDEGVMRHRHQHRRR